MGKDSLRFVDILLADTVYDSKWKAARPFTLDKIFAIEV